MKTCRKKIWIQSNLLSTGPCLQTFHWYRWTQQKAKNILQANTFFFMADYHYYNLSSFFTIIFDTAVNLEWHLSSSSGLEHTFPSPSIIWIIPVVKKERVKVPFIKVKSIHFNGETQMNGVWVLRGIWVVVYLLYYPFLFCYYYQYQGNTSLQSFWGYC